VLRPQSQSRLTSSVRADLVGELLLREVTRLARLLDAAAKAGKDLLLLPRHRYRRVSR
jgi:hypothetical protein